MADTSTVNSQELRSSGAALPKWSEIAEAGGIRNWVDAELVRRGLREDVDTSTLSDKQRKAFKAKR